MAAVDMGMGVAVTVADRLAVAVAVAVHRVAVVVGRGSGCSPGWVASMPPFPMFPIGPRIPSVARGSSRGGSSLVPAPVPAPVPVPLPSITLPEAGMLRPRTAGCRRRPDADAAEGEAEKRQKRR